MSLAVGFEFDFGAVFGISEIQFFIDIIEGDDSVATLNGFVPRDAVVGDECDSQY